MSKTILTLITVAFLSYCAQSIAQEKRISLSFDDAPKGQGPMFSGTERGRELLESLAKAKTGPVVFFVTTKHLHKPENTQRVENYAAAGHLIANHTHTHPWLHKTDLDVYLRDIDQAEDALTDFENRRPWFRFPFLDEGRKIPLRDQMRTALNERNLMNGYVTVDNYDWYIESKWLEATKQGKTVNMDALRDVYLEVLLSAVEFYDNLSQQKLGRSAAHTLLLHENDLAALFIDDLVNALREQGWQIIDPDTAYQDPIAKQTPETLITSQGRVAALAIDAGADPRTLSHMAIEEAQIDALIESKKVFSK